MAGAWRSRQIWRGLARVGCSLGEGAGELQHASCFLSRAPSQALSHSALLTQAQHAQQQQQQQRSIWSTAAAPAAAGAGSSGTGTAVCPLHACLLLYGITDLAALSKPRHLALSQEVVDADVEPKLAGLQAEGLSPAKLLRLLTIRTYPLLPCSYQDTFAPYLDLLRSLAALRKPGRRRKGQQQLTAAGQVLAGNASAAAHYLSRSPDAVQRLLKWLKRRLGLALKTPSLLTYNLEGRLPQLLAYLDGYMGEKGAGRRLVLRTPALGHAAGDIAHRGVSNLEALGYSHQQIQVCINQYAAVLWCDLASPEQQQKIEWIKCVSPWTLDAFFLTNVSYFFGISTLRLASRLAWMRAATLEPPRSPGTLAGSHARFTSMMSRRLQECPGGKSSSRVWLAVQGVVQCEVWVEKWLQSEEGQQWGYLPEN